MPFNKNVVQNDNKHLRNVVKIPLRMPSGIVTPANNEGYVIFDVVA